MPVWSWGLENIITSGENFSPSNNEVGEVSETHFSGKQVCPVNLPPHNRCYILPKQLHYMKMAGFVQNTTKNGARL